MSIDTCEVVDICFVGDATVTYEDFVVNDRCQRQPAKDITIQSYQLGGVALRGTYYTSKIHNNKK